jgi:membrane-bound ClpP family serine protease
MIEDSDADMLEAVLQKCDLSRGFALLLSSPGGDGLAAERVINLCRSYSGTGEYQVIIPGKAKSAATMFCLGASKLIMSKTSELGSIDPQLAVVEGQQVRRFSVYNILKSYEDLFSKAVKETGNLQPYLQQLANYDAREIAEFRTALSLAEDIAIKALKTGMLSRLSQQQIKTKIKVFLTPEHVKDHGRPIYTEEALRCGLNVEVKELKEKFWSMVYELYYRLDNYVSTNNVAKSIESKDHSFRAGMEG